MNHLPDPASADPTVETGSEEVAGIALKDDGYNSLTFLKAANRDLSESEIASAVTIRFLVERVKELQREKDLLIPFQVKYYEKDRDLAIEQGKNRLDSTIAIVSTALTGTGGAGMGIAANYFLNAPLISICAFIVSALVFGSALVLESRAR